MSTFKNSYNNWSCIREWGSYMPTSTNRRSLDWDTVHTLRAAYTRINDAQYKILLPLLERWDRELATLGGDPTYIDWQKFRPLRVRREEDWSDWLAFLMEMSKNNTFPALLFLATDATESKRLSIDWVEREVGYDGVRADIIARWSNGTYAHIEVKVGDQNLTKTFVTSERLRAKYSVPRAHWHNYIILLPEQQNEWQVVQENVSTTTVVVPVCWSEISTALRQSILSDKESTPWNVWAYSMIGVIEQKLLGFPGHRISTQPSESVALKIDVLQNSLTYSL